MYFVFFQKHCLRTSPITTFWEWTRQNIFFLYYYYSENTKNLCDATEDKGLPCYHGFRNRKHRDERGVEERGKANRLQQDGTKTMLSAYVPNSRAENYKSSLQNVLLPNVAGAAMRVRYTGCLRKLDNIERLRRDGSALRLKRSRVVLRPQGPRTSSMSDRNGHGTRVTLPWSPTGRRNSRAIDGANVFNVQCFTK